MVPTSTRACPTAKRRCPNRRSRRAGTSRSTGSGHPGDGGEAPPGSPPGGASHRATLIESNPTFSSNRLRVPCSWSRPTHSSFAVPRSTSSLSRSTSSAHVRLLSPSLLSVSRGRRVVRVDAVAVALVLVVASSVVLDLECSWSSVAPTCSSSRPTGVTAGQTSDRTSDQESDLRSGLRWAGRQTITTEGGQ